MIQFPENAKIKTKHVCDVFYNLRPFARWSATYLKLTLLCK